MDDRTGGDRGGATGVTAARGFAASGVDCGIRKQRRPDLALVVSRLPASAACVFTTNRVQAAPIAVCRENLATSGGRARAIVANAGNANACTGEEGLAAARRTAGEAARLLDVPAAEVLVASTGVIGQRLPVERLLDGLPAAVTALASDGSRGAADAILTTDTRRKEAVRRVETAAGAYAVGGIAKGSGMIHPDLATTLAFVTTDAAVEPALLQRCLSRATDVSFNRITVDGDTSTNDIIAVLANGASGAKVTADGAEGFTAALSGVLVELAREVARDGEGATRLVTVSVTGAATEGEALSVARTVAGSLLVKTAVHGGDANWGRVAAAAGRAGIDLAPERLRIAFGDVVVLRPGYVSEFSEEAATAALRQDEVVLGVDLGQGEAAATVWTCDLGEGYIRINGSYRS